LLLIRLKAFFDQTQPAADIAGSQAAFLFQTLVRSLEDGFEFGAAAEGEVFAGGGEIGGDGAGGVSVGEGVGGVDEQLRLGPVGVVLVGRWVRHGAFSDQSNS
jgi:hypothetical protein